jgi:hypothetical protein
MNSVEVCSKLNNLIGNAYKSIGLLNLILI